MEAAQKLLGTKEKYRQKLEDRIKEMRDLLDPIAKKIEILQKQASKAKGDYEEAIGRVTDQAQKKKDTAEDAPPKKAEDFMGWLRALKTERPHWRAKTNFQTSKSVGRSSHRDGNPTRYVPLRGQPCLCLR